MAVAWRIESAESAADLALVRRLFAAYATALPVDLAYQGFAAELRALPGADAPPAGALRLARTSAGEAVGCVALRSLGTGRAALKRLYVTPEGRGGGLGQALAETAIEDARRLGYHEIVLDDLPGMTAARALYRRLGFAVTEPYYRTPIAGTLFMRLGLDEAGR